jgi:pimeloyl-ACP methyl ester carboxylesterase
MPGEDRVFREARMEQNQGAAADAACPESCTESCEAACPMHGGAKIRVREAQARWATEARSGVLDTGRYRCHYSVWGEGPSLVFLPGLADRAAGFLLVNALLTTRFRCITYDFPEGRADGADLGRYSHPHLVDDLFALLDHLQASRAYVYAASFGTTIALEALRQRPERLPRALLQAPEALRPPRRLERVGQALLGLWPGLLRSLPFHRRALAMWHERFFDPERRDVWDYYLESTGQVPARAVAWQARLLHRLDLRPHLAVLRQPILLLQGAEDPLVADAAVTELLAALPNARRAVIPNCGHLPALTHPEVTAEVICHFLTPPEQCGPARCATEPPPRRIELV